MAGTLEIRDGSPWWLSPDIWVVPGNDPDGAPGIPVAGSTAFVWGRVRNNGQNAVMGARVDFWWADPSAQILRSTAHAIGSAFVDLLPGASQEVLCLTPWNVQLVNNGHECLLAAVSYPGSSVPTPAPDEFGPTLYDEIAQRNIDVLTVAAMAKPFMFALSATNRRAKSVVVHSAKGRELDDMIIAQLGLKDIRPASKALVRLRFSREFSCRPEGSERLEVKLEPGQRTAIFVQVEAEGIGCDEYALMHIIETRDGNDIGGCSILVLNP